MSSAAATVNSNPSSSSPITSWFGSIGLVSTALFLIGQIVFRTVSLNILTETYAVGGWLSVAFIVGMSLNGIAVMMRANALSKFLFGIALVGIAAQNIFTYIAVLQGGPFLFYPIWLLSVYSAVSELIFGISWAIISLCVVAGGFQFLRQHPLNWGNYLPFGIGLVFLTWLYPFWAYQIVWSLPVATYVKGNTANIIALAPFLILNALLSVALMQSNKHISAK